MSETILLCTVGGSHQPILAAIETNSPKLVCFFCTEGQAGSEVQVIGEGKVIKDKLQDSKATLPNIPTQARAQGWNGTYKIKIVPPDDLDGAFFVIRNTILKLAHKYPNAELVADYTGGTKTMTAALVSAVLDTERVELQLVAGERRDLIQVIPDTELSVVASVTRLLIDRDIKQFLAAWRHFGYHEAAEGLKKVRIAADSPDFERLHQAYMLSQGLALWDRFDHAGALEKIQPLEQIKAAYPYMMPTLGQLKADREQALLFDLWLNAERRAAQGRFDDAIARWYRMMEWTAQWQLRTKLNADTGDFSGDLLPKQVQAAPDSDGKIKIGLWKAWQVVKYRCELSGPAQDFIKKHGSKLLDLLEIRNNSILAHGFCPVSSSNWQEVHNWTQDKFLPVLRTLAEEVGLKSEPKQLPTEFPESI